MGKLFSSVWKRERIWGDGVKMAGGKANALPLHRCGAIRAADSPFLGTFVCGESDNFSRGLHIHHTLESF